MAFSNLIVLHEIGLLYRPSDYGASMCWDRPRGSFFHGSAEDLPAQYQFTNHASLYVRSFQTSCHNFVFWQSATLTSYTLMLPGWHRSAMATMSVIGIIPIG